MNGKHSTPDRSASPRDRLRAEFDLAILSIFGGTAALVIAGFAIYRFATGSFTGGVIDVGISLGLAIVVAYAWWGSDVSRAGAIFIAFAVIACVASAIVIGRTAAFWAFLVLSISFVVTGPRAAWIGSLSLIAAIAIQDGLFADLPERTIFVVTALLVTVYGWFFHARYDAQRRQLQTLASQDPLTGAGNRRAMRHALVGAIQERREPAASAVLAVLDLDHFKEVNDTHGHEAGDRVLVRLCEVVRERLRRGDGLFRMGGEEFVLLLADTDLDRATPVIEDLHRRVNQGMESLSMPVTVSIGVAELRAGEEWSDWLRRADEAMYQAKQSGRDRVVIDSG